MKAQLTAILLLVSIALFAQNTNQNTEVEQKREKVEQSRVYPTPTQGYERPRPLTYYGPYYQPVNPYYQPVNPYYQPVNPYYWSPNYRGTTPYWNQNRTWNNRTYISTNDESLTKDSKPPIRFSVGLGFEADDQTVAFTPYMTLGRQSFMIIQYHLTDDNPNPYYDNIETWETQQWGDEYQGITVVRREFAIGVGRSIDRFSRTCHGGFSPYIMIGFPSIRTYDNYTDETYTLSSASNSGVYSINEQSRTKTSFRIGTLYRWHVVEVMTQIRYDGRIGFGAGIGLKL